jgi:hypothetical protein
MAVAAAAFSDSTPGIIGMETALPRKASGRPGPSMPGSNAKVLGNAMELMSTPSAERGMIAEFSGNSFMLGPLRSFIRNTAPPEALIDFGWNG